MSSFRFFGIILNSNDTGMVLFQPNARHRKQLSANGRKRSKKASLLADLGRKFNHNQVGPRRVRIIHFQQLPSHEPTAWTWFSAACQILLSAWTWNWCNCLAPRWHVHQLNEISDIFSRRDQIRSNRCSSIQAHKLMNWCNIVAADDLWRNDVRATSELDLV